MPVKKTINDSGTNIAGTPSDIEIAGIVWRTAITYEYNFVVPKSIN